MPTITNVTVATGTGLSTAGNGGRKLVRLANGTLVSTTRNSTSVSLYKSSDNGTTWSILPNANTINYPSVQDTAIASKGDITYRLFAHSNTTVVITGVDANGNPVAGSGATLDSSQSALGNVSLAINDAGTELHAAWSSKNSTYPNSFNIRYAKGTINGDGSVTWGAVEQVTKLTVSSENMRNPSIALIYDVPSISADFAFNNIRVFRKSGSWSGHSVFSDSYEQSNPSSLFVPQSINGLSNGRLWVAWHGKDATDSAKFNIRVSYSDDGGVTWSTPVKLTSGNTVDHFNVTLSADKTGKVFALYEDHEWAPDTDIWMRVWNGTSWGAETSVAFNEPNPDAHPSALVDFSLRMTTPPFVFTDSTAGIKFSGNFNVGASVSPASGALGNKETATLTAYTVTPEAGSTVTQIVERVNGVTVNTFNNPASLSRTLTVPTATWDVLSYFASHTASITVTDSNGATTVTTYSFDKRLATNASLLEATKANTDAKNRISTKRDTLAAQVGLSAGSTFDAISAQLASGQVFKKIATGTVTADASGTISVTGLAFKPRIITVYRTSDKYISLYYDSVIQTTSYVSVLNSSPVYRTNMSVTNNGFSVTYDMFGGNTLTWTAIE